MIHKDEPQRRHTPVHDRLGKMISSQEQLEQEANARVPDDQPLVREDEYRLDIEYHQYESNPNPNQWCPGGLTRS